MRDIFNIGKHRFNRIIIPTIIVIGIMIFVEIIAISLGLTIEGSNIGFDVIILEDGINIIYAIGFICLATMLLWINVQEYKSSAILGIKMLPIKRYSYQLGNVIATGVVLLMYNLCQMIFLAGVYGICIGDIYDSRFILAMTRNAMTATICPLYLTGILHLVGFIIIYSALLNIPTNFSGLLNKCINTLSIVVIIYATADYVGRLISIYETPYYNWIWNIGGEKGMYMYQYHILIGLIMLVYIGVISWYNSKTLVGRGKHNENI